MHDSEVIVDFYDQSAHLYEMHLLIPHRVVAMKPTEPETNSES